MMWHHPSHMLMGKAAAAKSSKTPKHLIPHLQSQVTNMKKGKLAGNAPTTAQPSMKKALNIGGGSGMADSSTGEAEQQIAAPPMPFQNPRGAAQLPAPANQRATMNVGPGKGANMAGIKGSKAPTHPPTGPTGGYKPKKNFGPSGLSKFYGAR